MIDPNSWLDAHSGAVQAVASLLSLGTTIVLAVLTWRYVTLTKAIAEAGKDQISHLREMHLATTRRNAAHVIALSRRIRLPISQLDSTAPRHREILIFNHLSETDISALEAASALVSAEAATLAGKAAVSLREIEGTIQVAKAANKTTGWVAGAPRQQNWTTAMEAGPRMLQALEDECQHHLTTVCS